MPPTLSRSVIHPPCLPYWKLQMWPASPSCPQTRSHRANATHLSVEVLQLQGQMNMAQEWLLTTKTTLNSCQRELAWNTEIAMHQNEVQTTKAIKEVEVQHVAAIREAETCYEVTVQEAEACSANQAQALEQSNEESVLKLEHDALAEEGHDHWAFVEACGAALRVCYLKAHGVLIYPLQLLASGVSLGPFIEMPATGCGWHWVCLSTPHIGHTSAQTQHQAAASFIWPRHAQPGARRGDSLQLTWGAPHKKWKPLARNLLEAQWEAVNAARWTYHQTHRTMFEQERSYDLTSVFWEMGWKQTSWMLRYTRCRRHGLAIKGLESPITLQKPSKGIYNFSVW